MSANASRLTKRGWHPAAADLQLPDVPERDREAVRQFLSPVLQQIRHRIKGGDCYMTAKALMFTADDPRVQYVEGVWTRDKASGYYIGEDEERVPTPHAWNLVDGHLVDLVAEYYFWNSGGEDHPWIHEPLKAYTLDDMSRYRRYIGTHDRFNITVPICVEGWADEFGLAWTEADDVDAMQSEDSLETSVMRQAAQRLMTRRDT
jgi:hypothetical protein